MTHFGPTDSLYVALLCYAAGTVVALASLFTRDKRPQFAALLLMIGGFAAHTFWIGVNRTNFEQDIYTAALSERKAFLTHQR